MSTIIKNNTKKETAQALAKLIKEKVNACSSSFHLAVSGGSTPKMLFEELVAIKNEIEWQKLQLFWVDERMVPSTHDESNYRMTKEAMLDRVSLAEKNIHRMKGELSPEDSLIEYEQHIAIIPSENGYPKFDLIILGMGDDGHTASIFPHELNLFEVDTALAIGTNPYSGQKRLTLTGKTINNACEIIFHVTGINKAKVLDKILNKKDGYLSYPSSHIIHPVWYIDNEAIM